MRAKYSIPVGSGEVVYVRDAVSGTCEVHGWDPPDPPRLIDLMRARHRTGAGVDVCAECLVRHRDEAHRRLKARAS